MVRRNGGSYTRRAPVRTLTAPGVWHRARIGRKYARAREAAGLPEGTTSHDLRHHCASVLLDAGEPVQAVGEWLGDTPLMVMRVYGHLMPDREDRSRKAIDAAWEAASEAAPGVPGSAGRE